MKTYKIHKTTSFLIVLLSFVGMQAQKKTTAVFPAVVPLEKPDIPLSAAMHRLYDQWNPHEDRGNELYSNFKYSRLSGFEYIKSTSRRDPSKVIKIDGTYYVWYTKRSTAEHPLGAKKATEDIPSYDWDLCEIWYATSKNGFDCDLSLDVAIPKFKKNNLRLNEETYFQKSTALPQGMKKTILKRVDKNTMP